MRVIALIPHTCPTALARAWLAFKTDRRLQATFYRQQALRLAEPQQSNSQLNDAMHNLRLSLVEFIFSSGHVKDGCFLDLPFGFQFRQSAAPTLDGLLRNRKSLVLRFDVEGCPANLDLGTAKPCRVVDRDRYND